MNTPARAGLAEQPLYYAALIFLSYMLNYLDRSVLSILIVPIKRELHLSDSALGLLSGFGFVLVYAVAGIPLARLADRRGRHLIVGAGMLVWSAATAACGAASGFAQLVGARMSVGLGEAAGTAPSLALVADQYPRSRRPYVLGWVNAGGALGTALGLALGGIIAARFGWRAAFLVAGLPGVVIGVLIMLTLRDRRPVRPEGEVAAPLNLAASLRFIFAQRTIPMMFLGSAFVGLMMTAVSTWTPVYFSRVFALPIGRIGLTLGLIKGATGILGALAGGAAAAGLSARSERWQALVPALACLLSGPAYLGFVLANHADQAFAALGVGVFFQSASLGPIFAVYQSVTVPQLRSQVNALHILVASLGIGLGPLLIGLLNDGAFAGHGQAAIRYSMVLVAICGVIAAVFYGVAARFIVADAVRADEMAR